MRLIALIINAPSSILCYIFGVLWAIYYYIDSGEVLNPYNEEYNTEHPFFKILNHSEKLSRYYIYDLFDLSLYIFIIKNYIL